MEKTYICIDLKSFYASVECVERGLDPLKTNLVVADEERTEKTICLAVSPSLKQYGIGGRARLFEVIEKVKEVNKIRKKQNSYKPFTGKSSNDDELKKDKTKELSFIIAKPRMAHYIDTSAKIYSIYLKYLSSDDIFVYSIDEIFADITNYLKYYKLTPKELVTKIINDVYKQTGITATAGIGTNLFLAKVAMDVVAKHTKPNKYGVRIAELDEISYRKQMWHHKPITDVWRVGKGIASRLEKYGIYTMGDIARCSIKNEDLLYKLFGVNAELLIDHAWGWEPCTIESIKSYTPDVKSITSGQVLDCPYDYQKTKLVVCEMADSLALDLTAKSLVTDKLTLTLGYDIQNINNNYEGEITTDFYGRKIPKHAHGTITLDHKTSSSKIIMNALVKLYDKIINPKLLIKRINLTAIDVTSEELETGKIRYHQLDLFSDAEKQNNLLETEKRAEVKERKLQGTLLNIKEKYGKNSILKLMDIEEAATTKTRNEQIGGHHA
ncbi:impB/MucB/SamB family protein [Firmicutes bacterium CAG:822]|nr:impB/MucB/SamB family protein [Firmicutes bacterium CAG:822]